MDAEYAFTGNKHPLWHLVRNIQTWSQILISANHTGHTFCKKRRHDLRGAVASSNRAFQQQALLRFSIFSFCVPFKFHRRRKRSSISTSCYNGFTRLQSFRPNKCQNNYCGPWPRVKLLCCIYGYVLKDPALAYCTGSYFQATYQ